MGNIVSLAELERRDELASKKGRRWLRDQIKRGRLKAINTGENRHTYYVELEDWDRFKSGLLKMAPAE